MWGQKICIVVIPSSLAITYLGQSVYLHLISRFQFIALATWIVLIFSGNNTSLNDVAASYYWQNALMTTALTASMAVNTLVTGMIVFRILKVTGVRPTSLEGTLGSTGGNKFRHIMFIIIESGMALFSIQLVRVVLGFIRVPVEQEPFLIGAENIVIAINQMLNVIIIRFFHLYFFCFADNIYLARALHQQ